jgi:LmbE family N-acetylglucosaminyl deacetylase
MMATSNSDHEKQHVDYIEHVDTNDSALNLHKEQTLSGVDMMNRSALKGDDSDGKVIWSLRSILSAIFLAALYTGVFYTTLSSTKRLTLQVRR